MSADVTIREWQQVNAAEETSAQVCDAMAEMNIPADSYLRWPWPDLDALYGGMRPGTTHYVVGFSGMGKTTMIASALDRWGKAGILVDVLPLELKANTFRTYLACQSIGVDPGLMMSGDYHQRQDWKELRDRVFAALVKQNDDTTIRVRSTEFVDVRSLELACVEALERGAKALVVDHIDHIESGERGHSTKAASDAVNKAAFTFAKDYGLVLILMSQANNDALTQSRDHMAKYLPLRDTSVYMGGFKRQVATGMLGIFRPVRALQPGEPVEEYAELFKKARAGEGISQMLWPGRAGINLMKSRNYGSREGNQVFLSARNGYYDDLDMSERADSGAATHGIRTSTGLRLERGA